MTDAAGFSGVIDIVEACKWLSLAAAQRRDLFEEWMPPEDYSMAFQRIAEFRALPR